MKVTPWGCPCWVSSDLSLLAHLFSLQVLQTCTAQVHSCMACKPTACTKSNAQANLPHPRTVPLINVR